MDESASSAPSSSSQVVAAFRVAAVGDFAKREKWHHGTHIVTRNGMAKRSKSVGRRMASRTSSDFRSRGLELLKNAFPIGIALGFHRNCDGL